LNFPLSFGNHALSHSFPPLFPHFSSKNSYFLIPEVQNTILKVQNPVPEVQNTILKVQNPVPKVQNTILKVQNPVPEVQNTILKLQPPVLKVQNAILKIQSPIPEVRNAILMVHTPILYEQDMNRISTKSGSKVFVYRMVIPLTFDTPIQSFISVFSSTRKIQFSK